MYFGALQALVVFKGLGETLKSMLSLKVILYLDCNTALTSQENEFQSILIL